MALQLIVVGKTKEKYFQASESEYLKRLQRYVKLEYVEVPASRKETSAVKCLAAEAKALSKRIKTGDFVVLLDEHGEKYSSKGFGNQLNHWLSSGVQPVFVIGGAFGFHQDIKERANAMMALSEMTFPHQLVRTIFLEQLYRAFTILKGGKYHND